MSDLDRSFEFYTQLLALRPLARWKRGAYLLAGERTWLCLSLDLSLDQQKLGLSSSRGYSHVAFTVNAGFAETVARLRPHAPPWQDDSSEGDSYYFLDPDGHKLELHVGDWRSRLESCRRQPYDGMVFF